MPDAQGNMTLTEIAEFWNEAPPDWRANVISLLNASDEGKAQLRWIDQYQTAVDEDARRRAAEPPSTGDQIAANFGGPLMQGFGTAGGIALGNYLGSGASAAAPAVPNIVGASMAPAATAPGLAGTTAATGAGAGTGAATGTAAATGAAEGGAIAAEAPFLGIGLGPAAALAAGIYTGARGLNSARRQWQEGHGQQQTALMNLANPLSTGLNSMLGHPLNNEDAGYAGLALNPFTAPVGIPLAGYHYLGHEMLGLPDVPNFWSGKSKDQLGRDVVKNRFQESGLADQDYKLNINGNTYDLKHPTNPEGRNYYDINFEAEGAGDQASQLSAIANALGLTDSKQNSDAAGMLYNAINSGGDTGANMQSLLQQAGGHDALYTSIAQQRNDGRISNEEADVAFNALDAAAGVGAYAKKQEELKKKGLIGLGQIKKV